ncbi:Y-family DNA polymerase [Lacticaseibacillus suibinensis]|uniref:Y-family DNA polymerase n=1 Tax=Lacticaseibacillus suibinensis TaxID=2486011 RepID=UPI001CDBA9D4|nr:DNA polymerase [Lacticaseibacillus suibinensis]
MTPLDDPTRLPSRDLMCIDCKSFYASVEAIRRGEYPLAAKNAVLSRAESRGGLILAASPLTKANYGVKLGTRYFEIRPDMDIQICSPHMQLYIEINYKINAIYRQFAADEDWYVYSIDESFIDVTRSHSLFGGNHAIATAIQDKVFAATGIITTVGIGQNPLLAKLALDNEAKVAPPWQASWGYADVPNKLWKIDQLTDFWSIGSKTAEKLMRMGIYTLRDLAHTPLSKLEHVFGVLGDALYYHAWGIDYSVISRRYTPHTTTHGFGNSQVLMRDYTTLRDCETVLSEIAGQVATRLRKAGVVAAVVAIGVGFSEPNTEGKTHWGAQVQIEPTDRTNAISRAVRYLFEQHWAGEPLRHVAVRVSKVSKPETAQLSIFETAEQDEAKDQLALTLDKIRAKLGYTAIFPASSKLDGGTAIARSGLVGGHAK